MRTMVMASALLVLLQPLVVSPALALPVSERTYTANEAYLISSLSYQSSAARAALSRQFDNKFSEQKRLIDSKDAALGRAQGLLKRSKADAATAKAEIVKLEQEITSLKTDFLGQLSERDADFAREKAALEEDAQNLLRTPAGQEAMAVYLSSEPGAVKAGLLLFDQIAASRNEADKRRVAMLAYDSFQKGELTTQDVLTRLEGVAPPASRTHDDWYFLSTLYSRLVQQDNARNAAEKALETAQDDLDRLNAYSRLVDVLLEQEDFKGALVQSQMAQKLALQRLTSDPQNSNFRRIYASILSSLGDTNLKNRDYDTALSNYVEAAKIIRKLDEEFPNQLVLWRHIVSDSSRIGNIYADRKDFEFALSHFRYGMHFAKLVRTAFPQYTQYNSSLGYLHQRVGDLLLAQKDVSGALSEYVAVHAINVEMYRLDSAAYGPQNGLALSFLRLGEVKAKQGNFGGALSDYQQGADIIRKLSQEDPASREKLRSLAVAVGRVGNMLSETGNKKGAIASYKEALSIYRQLVQVDPSSFEDQDGVRTFSRRIGI